MQSAAELDKADELSHLRERFLIPQGKIYLDGNSLGLCSKDAAASLQKHLELWQTQGVEAWDMWIDFASSLGSRIARIVGANNASVVVTGSTTVNLHQMLSTLYAPTSKRKKILIDALAFPTDAYAVQSHLKLRGLDVTDNLGFIQSGADRMLNESEIIRAMTDEIAMIILPAVVYTTGQLLDLRTITEAAHERGILIGWDCSHSIGAVVHAFDSDDIDFAFWCSYKHLNGGPGAVGGLYLNQRHFGKSPGIAGWFGNRRETMFAMRHEFDPANDASGLQIGTPHILSMAPLEGSLNLIEEAGIKRIRQKSIALCEHVIRQFDGKLASLGFTLVSPRKSSIRGGHVTNAHPNAAAIARAMRSADVIPDFRPPDMIRLAPVALYNRFEEIDQAVDTIVEILRSGDYRDTKPASSIT